ncbi:hypothetical protein F4803DRAFT_209356 [Xylaria telfairii]|nr:hypothetical protein F4803DRAFT_209356 [Xylaria telfairii]
MAIYHNINWYASREGSRGDGIDNVLRSFLAATLRNPVSFRQPEAAKVLAREIGKKLFAFLLKPDQGPNTALGLVKLGLDSMVAVEMRVCWKLELGLIISVLEILATGTLLG